VIWHLSWLKKRRISGLAPLLIWMSVLAFCAVGKAWGSGLPDTVERIKRSIVGVGTVNRLRSPSSVLGGTGFVIGDGRHVLTNAHVLPKKLETKEKEFLAVFVGKGKDIKARTARPLVVDTEHDVAVLALDGGALPAVELGDSSNVREGQAYAFTGFPIGMVLGMYPATHRALIATITPIAIPVNKMEALSAQRIKRLRDPFAVFQLDATAYPGNSGSPLFHPQTGAVVGIVNQVLVKATKENVLAKPSGITYAIPIEHAKRMLDEARIRY
jgi:S1-C subfamily serine protease